MKIHAPSLALIALVAVGVLVGMTQPTVTSDIRASSVRLPEPPNIDPKSAPRFQPPIPFYVSFLHTQETALVWRTTVSSNVVRGEIWWNVNGWATNYDLKSSNVLGITTNTISIQ